MTNTKSVAIGQDNFHDTIHLHTTGQVEIAWMPSGQPIALLESHSDAQYPQIPTDLLALRDLEMIRIFNNLERESHPPKGSLLFDAEFHVTLKLRGP